MPYFQLPISNSLGQRFSKLPAHLNPRKVVKAIRKNVLYSCKHKFLLPKAFQSDLLFMGRHTLLTPPLEYHLLFEWPLFQNNETCDLLCKTILLCVTTIAYNRLQNSPYDRLYTTCRRFKLHDIRYETALCECRVAGVYYIIYCIF